MLAEEETRDRETNVTQEEGREEKNGQKGFLPRFYRECGGKKVKREREWKQGKQEYDEQSKRKLRREI